MQLGGAPEQPTLTPERCSIRFQSGEFPPHVITRKGSCPIAVTAAVAANIRSNRRHKLFFFSSVETASKETLENRSSTVPTLAASTFFQQLPLRLTT